MFEVVLCMFSLLIILEPFKPSKLKVMATTKKSVTLQWDNAEEVDESLIPPSGSYEKKPTYVVEISVPGEDKKNLLLKLVKKNEIRLDKLETGKNYNVRVAIDDSIRGTSQFSDTFTVTPGTGRKNEHFFFIFLLISYSHGSAYLWRN